jgi:hypothetical protein
LWSNLPKPPSTKVLRLAFLLDTQSKRAATYAYIVCQIDIFNIAHHTYHYANLYEL